MSSPTPVHSTVDVSTSEVTLVASRPSRRSIIVYNASDQDLYIKYTSGVSTTSFTIKVPPDWYGRMPWGEVYTGPLYAVWGGADPGGKAQITELIH